VLAITAWAVFRLFIVKRWVEDVEYEANVDANEALEELNEDGSRKEELKDEKEKEEEETGKKGKKK
jgi:hypothetical protein